MGDTGLEQLTVSSWKAAISPEGDAPDDALPAATAILTDAEPITEDALSVPLDDDLRRVLAVWPRLTVEERRVIADDVERTVAGR